MAREGGLKNGCAGGHLREQAAAEISSLTNFRSVLNTEHRRKANQTRARSPIQRKSVGTVDKDLIERLMNGPASACPNSSGGDELSRKQEMMRARSCEGESHTLSDRLRTLVRGGGTYGGSCASEFCGVD